MQKVFWVVVVTLVLGSCDVGNGKIQSISIDQEKISLEEEYILLDLLDLPLSDLVTPMKVAIKWDHSLQKESRYKGYSLHPILDYIVDSLSLDKESVVFTFQCDDGYLATTYVKDLYSREDGYIAFDDLDVEDKQWSDEMRVKYAPFYLVWENIPYGEHKMVWPYGWSKIRIIESDPYVTLKPTHSPELEKGFSHYKTHCLKCHAINKIGGEMGPDFNHPKNITTYWQREHIIAYAKNPSSYRWNTKMYGIDLTEDELHDVVDYLSYMKDKPLQD